MNEHYPFALPPLPYGDGALAPAIDKKTIKVHHDTLFSGYVTRLNAALKNYPQFHHYSLERLILDNHRLPKDIQTTVYNNAGGVYNHSLYFAAMTPRYRAPSRTMMRMIERSFGTYDKFKTAMLNAGTSVFGSGWAWLVKNRRGELAIITTKNQDTPLPQGMVALLPLDVWEHSYFLQYLAARNEYIMQWFQLINWDFVEKQLNRLL